MKTIILSDTSFLGLNYLDAKEGISYLKKLQPEYKIILMSNRPEECMRKIGVYINNENKTMYQYLGGCDLKNNGVDITIFNDGDLKENYNIRADFTIFGNGIAAFDNNDDLIYQGSFINRELLNEMINVFRGNGYRSYSERLSLMQNAFFNNCSSGYEDVYKFFTPQIAVDKINDRIYGMQCSSRGLEDDNNIISIIEHHFPEIIGYRLNDKPCFYQKNINKLVALKYISEKYNIDIDNSVIILSEFTDDIILKQYYNASYCIGDITHYKDNNEKNSLAKILKRL